MSNSFQNIKTWSDSTTVNGHLCRICFSLSDLLIPIFEGEGIKQDLYKKVQKYLPVKILPYDTLPQKVCYPCARTLVAWDSLYTICLKTDEILQSLLRGERPSEVNSNVDFDAEASLPSKKKLINSKDRITKSKAKKPKVLAAKKIKKAGIKSGNVELNLLLKKAELEKEENKMSESEKKIVNNSEMNEPMETSSADRGIFVTEIKTECNEKLEDNELAGNKLNNGGETQYSCFTKCEFCGKSYKSKKCLNRHMKKFHEDAKALKTQRCNLCSNVYKTKANLERHYVKEHLTNQEECPVCHASFNSKKLDLHLKSAHGVKSEGDNGEKFKCKICDKWFKNKYVRNSHMKDIHLSEPMKCKLCDFEGVQTVLRRHKRDVHAEKRFTCSLCPGAFKTLHTLKMHMTSHSDIRCYTCDICGMGFKRLNNVRDHMKCHEEKSNQCQICGNFFARKRYLAIHEKTIHNFYADGIVPEEKGFECGTCGAKLKWKKNLLAHMRIHTGEKPYMCHICHKDFICHGSLRTHMAKHSVCTVSNREPQNHASASTFNNINTEQVL